MRRRLRYKLLINNRENKSTEEYIKVFFFSVRRGEIMGFSCYGAAV